MKNRFAVWAVLLLLLVGVSGAKADDKADVEASNRQSALWHYPGYTIEDYRDGIDTPDRHFGLYLLSKGSKRVMLCYDLDGHADLCWAVSDAIPQGKGEARIVLHCEQEQQGLPFPCTCGKGMSILREAAYAPGVIEDEVSFCWIEDGFYLTGYMDRSEGGEYALLSPEGEAVYYDIEHGGMVGCADVCLLMQMDYVDFAGLPCTLERARKNPDIPPAIPQAAHPLWVKLNAQQMDFVSGRNLPVHMGPGSQFPRGGGNRASADTDHWIQVFGQKDGWLMIQYRESEERMRIGWVENDGVLKRRKAYRT